jgi:prophage tail gpP-like protein
MSDRIEIRINGKLFINWESINIRRSIDDNSSFYNFMSSTTAPADYPVKAGDFAQIYINETSVCFGFVDKVTSSGAKNTGQGVTISGRDNTQDLIDSSVPDSVKNLEGPLTLTQLCEKVIAALQATIKVTKNFELEEFSEETNFVADSGKKCMDFLVSFARKRQAYLIADGNGQLVIYRPVFSTEPTKILNEKNNPLNNIISWSVMLSHEERFNQYVVRSQDNFGFDFFADYKEDGIDRTGAAVDDEIRASRYIEIQAPETENEEETQQTSVELLNIRTANSTEYTCVLAGLTQSNGKVWNFGQFVQISDDYAGIKGLYMIKSVNYSLSLTDGATVTLTCVPSGAYQVIEPSETQKRKTQQAPIYQRDTPATPMRFPRS